MPVHARVMRSPPEIPAPWWASPWADGPTRMRHLLLGSCLGGIQTWDVTLARRLGGEERGGCAILRVAASASMAGRCCGHAAAVGSGVSWISFAVSCFQVAPGGGGLPRWLWDATDEPGRAGLLWCHDKQAAAHAYMGAVAGSGLLVSVSMHRTRPGWRCLCRLECNAVQVVRVCLCECFSVRGRPLQTGCIVYQVFRMSDISLSDFFHEY
jgi:hypothetical protein